MSVQLNEELIAFTKWWTYALAHFLRKAHIQTHWAVVVLNFSECPSSLLVREARLKFYEGTG
jgi:hypothetical protein